MSDREHRAIGRILGFPACCVEQWLRGSENQGIERGGIFERMRSPSEARILDGHVSMLLGRPWDGCASDPRKVYVPCDAHVGAPGWFP